MTEKLYYEDVYMREFDARVTACREGKKGFMVFLDRSAFFPEGGGQSGDRGYLVCISGDDPPGKGRTKGDTPEGKAEGRADAPGAEDRIPVLDTQETEEGICVLTDREVPEGTKVHGVLDWQFRFDRMQNHSGEHIVSGIIHSRFGYQNVGFHMSAGRMTIDLDGEITDEDLREIERRANEIVWSNADIRTDVYTEQEAENVEFRSKKELHGEIRVVTIPGADVCACCGTHVRKTGEIGPIRIISHERFRGGIRMELMCGRWAYDYMTEVFAQNHQVSMLVSAKPLETAKAVGKVLEDENALKYTLLQKRYAEIDLMAEKLKDKGNVLIFAEDYDPSSVQKLAARVMETCGGTVIAMSGDDEGGYRFAAGETGGDLRALISDMNRSLNGRGGGRPYFQQGSVSAKREEIEQYLKKKIGTLQVISI